jgi:hypothetical protein
MKLPIYLNTKFVDKNGMLTSDMQHYMDNQSQTLHDGLGDDGWTLPQQTTANINTIAPNMPNGTMWYDTNTNEFKVLIAGVVKVVTVV